MSPVCAQKLMTLDVVGTGSGRYAAAGNRHGPRLRAHFRSDAARLASATEAGGDALVIDGVIAQTIYVGQGYRYRVRAAGADIWVHAPERVAEGSTASVVVPREMIHPVGSMLDASTAIDASGWPRMSTTVPRNVAGSGNTPTSMQLLDGAEGHATPGAPVEKGPRGGNAGTAGLAFAAAGSGPRPRTIRVG